MMKHKKKNFDCIEIKRKVQEEIYEDIKQLSPEEEINYFRKSVEKSKLYSWWKSISSGVETTKTL